MDKNDLFNTFFGCEDLLYDREIYEIAYMSKSMEEAFQIANKYTEKYRRNMIVGLALQTAYSRLNKRINNDSCIP